MRGRRSRFRTHNNDLSILNIIKLVLLVLIIIFAVIFIFSSFNMKNKLSKTSKNENLNISNIDEAKEHVTDIKNYDVQENPPVQESSTTINMAFTGDIMCHTSIYNDAYDEESETYDFSYIFENVKYNIQTADIAVRKFRNYFFWKFGRI